MLLNDICPRHKQTRGKKPFTCPVHSGYNGQCTGILKHISNHIYLPMNALHVGKKYKKRTSFSGGPIFSNLMCLITFFMVMSGCATVPLKGCPGPDYIIQENGICCGVITCKTNYTVSMCRVKYGNDTCVPCPEGSFLLDPTSSITARSCIKPVCMKNKTRPSLVKSTTVNQFACPQWCQCDLSFHYCGTDPCKCRKVICPFRTVPQQDCGCRPITPSPPKPTPSKMIPVTWSNFTTLKPGINVTTRSNTSTVGNTPTPDTVTPFPSGTTIASYNTSPKPNNTETTIIIVASVIIASVLVILGIFWFARNKCNSKQKKVKTTEQDAVKPANITNHHYHVNVENAKLVQVGAGSETLTNINEDDVNSPEDEVTENKGETQPFIKRSQDREQNNAVETEAVIENRNDHSREDLSMDGPKSSLLGSSSNIQDNVADGETEVKTVIATSDNAIELKTFPDRCKQAPLVENEDTSLGIYAGEKEIDSVTNVKTVGSGNHSPDSHHSPTKQQNGVVLKESCNGHNKNSETPQFQGFR